MLRKPKYKLRLSLTILYQTKSEEQNSIECRTATKSRLPFYCLNKLCDWSHYAHDQSDPRLNTNRDLATYVLPRFQLIGE